MVDKNPNKPIKKSKILLKAYINIQVSALALCGIYIFGLFKMYSSSGYLAFYALSILPSILQLAIVAVLVFPLILLIFYFIIQKATNLIWKISFGLLAFSKKRGIHAVVFLVGFLFVFVLPVIIGISNSFLLDYSWIFLILLVLLVVLVVNYFIFFVALNFRLIRSYIISIMYSLVSTIANILYSTYILPVMLPSIYSIVQSILIFTSALFSINIFLIIPSFILKNSLIYENKKPVTYSADNFLVTLIPFIFVQILSFILSFILIVIYLFLFYVFY